MSSGEPRKSRGQKKRELIRRFAYECFRDMGYHDTTVDAICKRAGISKGSYYWHYGSKQEVFIDILETWSRQVIDELHVQFETVLRHKDYMQSITDALEREMHRGRVIVPLWLEFSVHARREPEIRSALSKFYRRARTAIAELMRPAVGELLDDEELHGVAAAIFGGYAGIMMQDLSDPDAADASRAFRSVMPVLGDAVRQFSRLNEAVAQRRSDPSPGPQGSEVAALGRVDDERLESFLSLFPGPVGDRLETLRRVVLEAVPVAHEKLITGWKVLAYETDSLFCTLKPRLDDVLFGFTRGTDLPDPDQLLVGRGKRKRHVLIPVNGPLPLAGLSALVRSAATLASQPD